MPSLAVLVRLAGALGVPVERFAEGVEDPVELDADPGHTDEEGAGGLPAAQEKPKERKVRRPLGDEDVRHSS
jgi:hypothetical protein